LVRAVHFSKHYTVPEARALLPKVRQWLGDLESCQKRLRALDHSVSALTAHGDDAGGETVNQLVRAVGEMQDIFQQFQRREIQIKDLGRGLVDFPSLREGREVFLCWEKDEEDIEFWHDLESGYAGRERL
jgi:hypothetical protein